MDELIHLLDDPVPPAIDLADVQAWKVLVVDDEPEVHAVTRLALRDFRFEGRPVQLLAAHSAAEARTQLRSQDDIALALVDVVMETDHAGLDLVRWIRDELNNHFIRIVLRTGQPGRAPEPVVANDYDINDYKDKTELTSQKLATVVRVALRGYRDILAVDQARRGLERVIAAASQVYARHTPAEFASAVLSQLAGLTGMQRGAVCVRVPPPASRPAGSAPPFQIAAATGEFEPLAARGADASALPEQLRSSLQRAFERKQHQFATDHYVLHFTDSQHGECLLYVGDACALSEVDLRLVELFCTQVSIAFENLHLNLELLEAQREMICLLAGAAESRSKETAAHVLRVGLIAERLARALGWPPERAELLRHAAPLHDLGKIAIPDAILNKPGRHDPEERAVMCTHAQIGAELLNLSRRPLLRLAAEIAASHHEHWDGSGYPHGLRGEAIPASGRIVAVADVFDALGSRRCYKEPWPESAIRAHFIERRGSQFDPAVVDALLAHWEELAALRRHYPDPV
ncbi:MAG: transcriptional regulator [Lysobacteraceae bacterium]|nr:MAG: transcriptional regulator [Xanthomonadaceae bacterium]